jgi:hypothetical protein
MDHPCIPVVTFISKVRLTNNESLFGDLIGLFSSPGKSDVPSLREVLPTPCVGGMDCCRVLCFDLRGCVHLAHRQASSMVHQSAPPPFSDYLAPLLTTFSAEGAKM